MGKLCAIPIDGDRAAVYARFNRVIRVWCACSAQPDVARIAAIRKLNSIPLIASESDNGVAVNVGFGCASGWAAHDDSESLTAWAAPSDASVEIRRIKRAAIPAQPAINGTRLRLLQRVAGNRPRTAVYGRPVCARCAVCSIECVRKTCHSLRLSLVGQHNAIARERATFT